MQAPLLDLKAQYFSIKEEVRGAIDEVLESQRFIMGPQVERLERKIAVYVGCNHAVGVASGSDALLMSLMAADIKPGDAVITTPYTFFATAGAIARLGAIPIFVDINSRTYNIDPTLIARKITKKTRAIIPVHLYGQPADMDPIMDIARHYDLIVIEDAAQAMGSEYENRRVGSIGHFGCFSFFPSKNLGCFGDGGMVTTNNDEYAEKLRVLRVHGSKPKYYHNIIGMNSRLDAIQAAILEVKLCYLDKWNAVRKDNAKWYDAKFRETGLADCFVVLPYSSGHDHVYHQYVIRCKRRDDLMKYLNNNGIGCEVYYPVPLHLQKCFNELGHKIGDYPVSERATKETLALPIYPELTLEQKEYVLGAIKKFYMG